MTRRLTTRSPDLADDVPSWLCRSRGETTMAVRGHLYDAAALPALVAATDTDVLGVLTYTLEGHALEPSIPLRGCRGLPIRDEIDLERTL